MAGTFVLATLGVAAFVLASLGVTATFFLTSLGFAGTFVLRSLEVASTLVLRSFSFTSAFVIRSLGMTGTFVFTSFSLASTFVFASFGFTAATLGFATAASGQFGTSLSVGLHIVSIIAELADTFADGIGSRLFGIIGDRQLGGSHIIDTCLNPFKCGDSSLHHLGTAATLAVGLDRYILRGLSGQSQSGHHDQQ